MSSSPNAVIYGSGLFGRNLAAQNATQLAAVKSSGFTTVILWALHVNPAGDLAYNDTVIVRNGVFTAQFNYLADLITDMKSGGTVDTVLFSIGGWGVTDFTNLQNLLSTQDGRVTVIQSFNALATALPIDGFDFDLEENGITVQTIVDLTKLLNGVDNSIVTYCPYSMSTIDWVGCLAQVYQQNNNQQIVKWFNLQCYAGGAGNLPQQWAGYIQSSPLPTGVANPAAFVLPGYTSQNGAGCNQGNCPSDIRRTFFGLTTSDPGIAGGFLWNSGDLFNCEGSGGCGGAVMSIGAYAEAMLNGLHGIA